MKTFGARHRSQAAFLAMISGLTILAVPIDSIRAQEIDYGNFKKKLPGSMWYEFIDVTPDGTPRGFVYIFASAGSYNPAVPNLFGSGLNPYTGWRILLEGDEATEASVFTYDPVGSDFTLSIEQSGETIFWEKQSCDWANGYLVFVDWSNMPFGTPWNQQIQYAEKVRWFSVNSTFFRQYILPWHYSGQ